MKLAAFRARTRKGKADNDHLEVNEAKQALGHTRTGGNEFFFEEQSSRLGALS